MPVIVVFPASVEFFFVLCITFAMPLSGDEKRGQAADASLHRAVAAAEPSPAKGRHRSRGVKRVAQTTDWDWAKLLAEDTAVLDATWCTLLNMPELSAEVPVESRATVLDVGFRFWTMSATLTTTRCTLLFRNLVGLPRVSSEFLKYRDSFLFALAVHWDVDVMRYDLSPEQSQAAFGFVDYLSNATNDSAAGTNSGSGAVLHQEHGMGFQSPHAGPSAGEQRADDKADIRQEISKYAMVKGNIKAVRKRAGASKWAIRLGRIREGALDTSAFESMGGPELDLGSVQCETEVASYGAVIGLAQEVWDVLLRTEEGA